MEKYFYLPSSKEIVDSREQFCTIKIENFEFVHLQNIKGKNLDVDPPISAFQKKNDEKFSTYQMMKEARIKSLHDLLDYIKVNQT